jgi:hypothetical protein
MDNKFIFQEKNLKHWDWAVSHACVPTALAFDSFIRIYFSPRNATGQSIPVYIDVDINTFSIIKYGDPIIELGEIGTFDDGGIMPCSVVKNQDKIYLYYVGWNPSVSVPYRNSIGVCVSEDNGVSFKKIHPGPVVDRSLYEPFFTASPCVIKENNLWKMWYASSTGFVKVNDQQSPLYHIKYAESNDGVHWVRNNISCITPNNEYECTARPSIIKENGIYKMWYCYRGSFDYRDGKDSYQIGYAESSNGINWERKDNNIKFNIGSSSYDNKMTCYPNVINVNNQQILFYNGNSFGKQGIMYNIKPL